MYGAGHRGDWGSGDEEVGKAKERQERQRRGKVEEAQQTRWRKDQGGIKQGRGSADEAQNRCRRGAGASGGKAREIRQPRQMQCGGKL